MYQKIFHGDRIPIRRKELDLVSNTGWVHDTSWCLSKRLFSLIVCSLPSWAYSPTIIDRLNKKALEFNSDQKTKSLKNLNFIPNIKLAQFSWFNPILPKPNLSFSKEYDSKVYSTKLSKTSIFTEYSLIQIDYTKMSIFGNFAGDLYWDHKTVWN